MFSVCSVCVVSLTFDPCWFSMLAALGAVLRSFIGATC